MSNINKVILIGRLGRDPEVRFLENGTAVAKFGLATSEAYKDKNSGEWIEQTEWHDVVMWRFLAERAEKQLKKGMLIYVEGKLRSRKWQKEGEESPRRFTEVVAETFRMLSKRENADSGYFPSTQDAYGGTTASTSPSPVTNQPSQQNTAPAMVAKQDEPADDLPF